VTFGWRDDGRWWLRALLPADEGAQVQRALEAARDAEFTAGGGHLDRVTWCDALGRLARAGLDALTTSGGESDRPPAERTQVLIHVDADRPVPARLHLGPLLPDPVARYLACDATVRAVLERDARPVGLGRRRRTVPTRLRTLIEDRDRGCRVPGCGHTRWLHIHHLIAWADGGGTDPSNLLALCPFHHRMLHTGRLRITGDPDDPDGLTFSDDRGRELTPARARPPTGQPPTTPPYRHPSGEHLNGWMIVWN
jgi:Domain of unknown function (DUF222)/HNH endonuclease